MYASNEGEFIVRLRSVFNRFRQYNITLNPKKCSFVIKPDGVSFSTEKRGKVLDFPFPKKKIHLRSFLGLVNYFRDHVKELSTMVKPLNDMVNPYKKNTQIFWTPQMEQVFIVVQEAVGNCPKLFYVDMMPADSCTHRRVRLRNRRIHISVRRNQRASYTLH